MWINCRCDPRPSAHDRWVTRRRSSTLVFATCLHHSRHNPDTVDTSSGISGSVRHVFLLPPYFSFRELTIWATALVNVCPVRVVHMWLPGRGPACHRLAWDRGRRAQALQMCAGVWMAEESGCPHVLCGLQERAEPDDTKVQQQADFSIPVWHSRKSPIIYLYSTSQN